MANAIPDSMLAARAYEGADQFKLEEVPVPEIGAGEVLIKVAASGIVRGMITLWKTGRIGELPATLGPQMAGEVAAVGPGVTGWQAGDRVRVDPNLSCRTCDYCLTDRDMMCDAHSIMGHASFGPAAGPMYERYHNGGLAEYVRAPEWALDRMPPDVSFAVAAKVRDMATSYQALSVADLPRGATLVVTAATGSQGVSAIRMAPHFGIGRLIAVGRSAERLKQVQALDPALVETLALDELPGWEDGELLGHKLREITGGGADAVLDLTPPAGGPLTWEAFRGLRTGGTGVIVGGNLAEPSMGTQEIMVRCLRIIGTRNCARRYNRQILRLMAGGRLTIDDLITHQFPLSAINDALATIEDRGETTWMVGVDVSAG